MHGRLLANLLHTVHPAGIIAAILFLLPFLAGCRSSGADLTLKSQIAQGALTPRFGVALYSPIDRNTADVYLSDIPIERLTNKHDDLAGVQGNLVHIHIFLMPVAGLTPIENTACNITVRHMVLAGPPLHAAPLTPPDDNPGAVVIGIYGGGGFFFPSTSSGSDVLRGTLRDATLRLVRATPGFLDKLGIAHLTGGVDAERDDRTSRLLAARFESLVKQTTPAPTTAPAAPAPAPP